MKKLLLILSLVLMASTFDVSAAEKPEVTDHEKVTIYLFWMESCGYCEMTIEMFNELEDEYEDYFEVVTINVNEDNNVTLYDYFADLLGDSGGVPYMIVGDQHIAGYSESIVDLALEEYQNNEYEDIVASYVESSSAIYALEDLEYACDIKGIDYWNSESPTTTIGSYIAIGVFALLIGGMAYLVFIPKKN